MTALSLHSVDDLYSKWWLLLGGRASGIYATAPIMTLIPCDLDLLNDFDLSDDLDLDFQCLHQVYIKFMTYTRSDGCYLVAVPAAYMPLPL